MKIVALLILAVLLAMNTSAQTEVKPCNAHSIGYQIKDSLAKPVAIFKFLRCQDSTIIKEAKAVITLKSGKTKTKNVNKNGEFVFEESEFLQVKQLELKSKDYMSMIYSEYAIEQKQSRLSEGISWRYFYYTIVNKNNIIECTWE